MQRFFTTVTLILLVAMTAQPAAAQIATTAKPALPPNVNLKLAEQRANVTYTVMEKQDHHVKALLTAFGQQSIAFKKGDLPNEIRTWQAGVELLQGLRKQGEGILKTQEDLTDALGLYQANMATAIKELRSVSQTFNNLAKSETQKKWQEENRFWARAFDGLAADLEQRVIDAASAAQKIGNELDDLRKTVTHLRRLETAVPLYLRGLRETQRATATLKLLQRYRQNVAEGIQRIKVLVDKTLGKDSAVGQPLPPNPLTPIVPKKAPVKQGNRPSSTQTVLFTDTAAVTPTAKPAICRVTASYGPITDYAKIPVGGRQGLAVGTDLELWRHGRRIGTVRVDIVHPTYSLIYTERFTPRVGDTVHLPESVAK